MVKPVRIGIEVEYLLMTDSGGPIYSGWRRMEIEKFLGLQILRDAALALQPGIQRESDAQGHKNVYRFRDGKVMLPDTYTLLETITTPSTDLDVLRDQLWAMKNALVRAADRHRGSVVSGAACPVAYRYEDVARQGSITANNAGMHVHVEAPNDKLKIKFYNLLMQIMPELTALTANSSIYNQQPSGYRSKRLSASPLVGPTGVIPMTYEAGRPLRFDNPSNRYRYVTPYTKSKRTIELRGFDTPMTIDWVMAIAAITQCLAAKAYRLFIEERRNTVVGNNSKIRQANFDAAMTYGLRSRFQPDPTFGINIERKRRRMSFLYHGEDAKLKQPVPATLAAKRLLYYVEAEAYELGLTSYLQPFYDAIRLGRDQAQQQLDWFHAHGFWGYFNNLKAESGAAPRNRCDSRGQDRTYLTIRERSKNADSSKVYVSHGGLAKLGAQQGDRVVLSGPLGSIRAEIMCELNSSGTLPLADDEIRLGQKFRRQLGVSVYDPVIIAPRELIPIAIARTNEEWAPAGPSKVGSYWSRRF